MLNAGNPTGYTGNPLFKVNAYPAGPARPTRTTTSPTSTTPGCTPRPTAAIEYKNTVAFGGALTGKLIVVRYSANQEIVDVRRHAPTAASPARRPGSPASPDSRSRSTSPRTSPPATCTSASCTDNPATTGIKLLKPQGGGQRRPGRGDPAPGLHRGRWAARPARQQNVTVKNIGGRAADDHCAPRSPAPTPACSPAPARSPADDRAPAARATHPGDLQPDRGRPARGDPDARHRRARRRRPPRSRCAASAPWAPAARNEPSLQWILDTLQIPVNVGDADPTNNAMPDADALLGDEVEMPVVHQARSFDHIVEHRAAVAVRPGRPVGQHRTSRSSAAHRQRRPDPPRGVVLFTAPTAPNQTVLPDVTTAR